LKARWPATKTLCHQTGRGGKPSFPTVNPYVEGQLRKSKARKAHRPTISNNPTSSPRLTTPLLLALAENAQCALDGLLRKENSTSAEVVLKVDDD
jgi:hypothetical protein